MKTNRETIIGKLNLLLSLLLCISLASCGNENNSTDEDENTDTENGDENDSGDTTVDEDGTTVYGQNAAGNIPEALPDRMLLGLVENPGVGWMAESGVAWDSRYIYLSNGWVDNWGWGDRDGGLAMQYMEESDAIGAIPVLEFYVLNNIGEGSTAGLYTKTTDADTMSDYFENVKILFERAKEFGKPVVVLVEADGFAFLQLQSESDPQAYAAVADCGLPELSELPNTLAGWGMAFLELKKQVGAENVSLGMHISAWATGADLMYQAVDVELEPAVENAFDFLAPMGLIENQTGLEYDFLVGDPLDRDSDFYVVEHDNDKWWDVSPDAPTNSKSFNRYAQWLSQWNRKSEKRWILWQIALGNQFHLNVYNEGGDQEGYKDNRVDYFLGDNYLDNLARFADAGVSWLLFGAGAGGQSTYTNDYDDDGELVMKTNAAKYYDNGAMTLKR